MKRFLVVSVVVIGVACLASAAPQSSKTPQPATAKSTSMSSDDMIAAAKALDQKFMTAFNKGDVDGMMACYWNSPDLVVFPPDEMQFMGYNNVTTGLKNLVKSKPGMKMEMLDSHYQVAGDYVIGWGTFRGTPPAMASGSTTKGAADAGVMMGRFTVVYAKKDGKWVYVLDHASCPMPAEGMTGAMLH